MVWKSNNLIMTCTNCRNPLSENSTICEWCGNDNSKPNTQTKIVEKKKVNKKALKYTIYFVLFLLLMFIYSNSKSDFKHTVLFIIIPIIIYEFYLYLARIFQK
jgi:inner membrane protein involved in colicin E2 resistance